MKKERMSVAITTALRFTAFATLIMIGQLYIGELNVARWQISLLSAVNWIGVLFFSPVWGALSDVLGKRKKLIVISLLGTTLTYSLLLLFHSYWIMIGLFLCGAIFGAGFVPLMLALVSDKIKQRRRGKQMCIFTASRSLGFFMGRIGYWILLSFYLPLNFQLLTVLLIFLVSFTSSVFLSQSSFQKTQNLNFTQFLQQIKQRLLPSLNGLNLLETGGIFLLISIALRKGAIVGVFSLLYVYMSTVGISKALIGITVAVNSGTQIFFMLLMGKLADQIGRKKIFSFGFATCALTPFLLAVGKTIYVFMFAMIILGIGFSGVQTGTVTFIKDIAPKGKSAELLGFRMTSQGIAAIILTLVAGKIASNSIFGYSGMFQLMGGIMILAFIISFFLTEETFYP